MSRDTVILRRPISRQAPYDRAPKILPSPTQSEVSYEKDPRISSRVGMQTISSNFPWDVIWTIPLWNMSGNLEYFLHPLCTSGRKVPEVS